MEKLNAIDILALALVIVGALNWGLVGFFNFNLVTDLFGEASTVTQIVYAAVGLAGLYLLAIVGVLRKE